MPTLALLAAAVAVAALQPDPDAVPAAERSGKERKVECRQVPQLAAKAGSAPTLSRCTASSSARAKSAPRRASVFSAAKSTKGDKVGF